MTTTRKLNALLFELQTARSPLQQARILVRAWRTLRELSPTDRRLLARHAGFDGAEEILEGLAKRRGGLAPAMLLRVLANARSTDGAAVSELLSAVRNPLRRDDAVRLGAHLAADLLAEDDSEPAAEDHHQEVGEALGELQAVESAVEESPEEALAALTALDEDDEQEEVEKPAAEDAAEAQAASEIKPPPSPPPEMVPPPPAPPIVDWDRWRTTPQPPRPGPTPRLETAPAIDDAASRRFDAQAVLGALGAEASVLSRLRVLRRELSGFSGSSLATLREVVESFEDGWARRRALAAFLEAGMPDGASDALDLIATLDRESDRRWCLGLVARRGGLRGATLGRALQLVSSPSARRRIETAARG